MTEGRAKYEALVERAVARLKARGNRQGMLLSDRALMIEINRGCNAGCTTCFRLDTSRQTMEPALFRRVMDFADHHLFMAYIYGGEPTECLEMIVEAASTTPDLLTMLITFGENLTRARVRLMASSPNIFPVLSVDGIGEINDRSRRPGAFARIQRSIEELDRQGLPFGIGTTVSRINLDQVLSGEMAAWVESIGAAVWDIIQYHPVGEDVAVQDRLMLDATQRTALSSYRMQLFERNPYGFAFYSPDSPKRRCPRKLKVMLDGKIAYCSFSAWELGSIAVTDTDETIAARLQDKRDAWVAMAATGNGYCPLTHATEAYIVFHERHGRPFQAATGMLNRANPIHRRLVRPNGDSIA